MSLYFYNEKEDENKEESINNYKDLFLEYTTNPPTLESALQQMFVNSGINTNNANQFIQDIITKTEKVYNKNIDKIKIKYPNINKEDIKIISAYTCESMDKNYSPYRILNQNLVSENRILGIRNISKYLFIFLKSLRKLEKYHPNSNSQFLYRCIRGNVKINYDMYNPKSVPFIPGKVKTFWSFTSTSPNAKSTYDFLQKTNNSSNKSGTIFTLTGNIWGYDITLLNYFGENEILLEPERKFLVNEVLPPINGIIHIRCNIQETPLVLSDIINNNINNNSSNIQNPLTNVNIWVRFFTQDKILDVSFQCSISNKIGQYINKLVEINPKLLNKKLIFLYNGRILDEYKSFKENQIKNKDEICVTYQEINNNLVDMNDIMSVNFISGDQSINYNVPCLKSDKFKKCKEKLLKEFPQMNTKKNYFMANGLLIDENKTMIENKIKSGDNILININDDNDNDDINIPPVQTGSILQFPPGSMVPVQDENSNVYVPYQPIASQQLEMMKINFIDIDQNIDYSLSCNKDTLLKKCEEKLFNKYPYLKSKNLYYLCNERILDRNKSLKYNRIKSGDKIIALFDD